MPFQDMINLHFTPAEAAQFNTLVDQIENLLQSRLRNLSQEENVRIGVISEKNKLFVNKVRDYRINQPNLSSPEVDWVEFEADYFDRGFLENGALRLEALAKTMTETRRLHDYDNYQNGSIDYGYTKYRNSTQAGAGYDSKEAEYAQFFEKQSEGGATRPDATDIPDVGN